MFDVNRIINIIEKEGYSIASFEKAIGFGNGTIKRWATSSPSIDRLYKLADFLNISIDYLLTGNQSSDLLTKDQNELLFYWEQLSPTEQAEFKGELKGYIRAKNGKSAVSEDQVIRNAVAMGGESKNFPASKAYIDQVVKEIDIMDDMEKQVKKNKKNNKN